jgi:hypothetical protein
MQLMLSLVLLHRFDDHLLVPLEQHEKSLVLYLLKYLKIQRKGKTTTNCVVWEANACGRVGLGVTSSDCLVFDELIEVDDVNG